MLDKRLFHYNCLKAYNNYLYDTLLMEHHITSDTIREISFKDKVVQGYFAKKNKILYLLDKEVVIGTEENGYKTELPIRIKEYKEDVAEKKVYYLVTEYKSFRITPVKTMEFKALIDTIAPFNHTNKEDFILYKILCLSAYCSRTFTRISTNPGFGKDSIKGILNALTDKVKIIKPRSIPGVLKELTTDGELVLNESSGMKKEIRDLIQEIILQLADGSVTYINGAVKSQMHNTKDKYDVHKLSITAMFNRKEDYSQEDEFFDNQFANNTAIKDRLLPIKLSGCLIEQFQNDFDYQKLMEENTTKLAEIIKNIEYWKYNWQQEQKPYSNPRHNIKGRHKQTLEILFSFINLYSKDQEEHNKICQQLLNRIQDYKDMTEGIITAFEKQIEMAKELDIEIIEENIEEFDMEQNKEYSYEELEKQGYNIGKMLTEGDIFEVRPGWLRRI